MFDWLIQVQASPLTYLAVLGACALDAVLPIMPSEAVVIAASILAARGELSIWLIALAAAAGGFLGDTGSYVLGRTAGAAAAGRLFRSSKAKGRLTWAGEALDRHGAHHHRGGPIYPRGEDGDHLHRRNGAVALAQVCRCRRGWCDLVGGV